MGMMVTHFSFGSLFFLHGCSTSPLRTRLDRKNLGGAPAPPTCPLEDEPKDEPGLETSGVAKGLGLGVIWFSWSRNGSGPILLSGVSDRAGVLVVEAPVAVGPL